jgi:hypothetical protein
MCIVELDIDDGSIQFPSVQRWAAFDGSASKTAVDTATATKTPLMSLPRASLCWIGTIRGAKPIRELLRIEVT